jgi:ATP-dependent protease HslVU (ClpYQ) peptidase subunit
MTLILAITCKDGVVLASDGQATAKIDDEKGVKSTSQKIVRLGKYWLGGCSGSAIDVQRLQTLSNIPDAITEPQLQMRLNNFARDVIQDSTPAFDSKDLLGRRCAEYLVVGHHEHPMIWHMVSKCQFVFHSKDLPEITDSMMFAIGTGSGQIVAQALFERLKTVYPTYTLTQGSLIAYRLVKVATSIDPYVGDPIAIWTVSNNKVEPKSDAGLKKLESLFDEWKDIERRVSQDFLSSVN